MESNRRVQLTWINSYKLQHLYVKKFDNRLIDVLIVERQFLLLDERERDRLREAFIRYLAKLLPTLTV